MAKSAMFGCGEAGTLVHVKDDREQESFVKKHFKLEVEVVHVSVWLLLREFFPNDHWHLLVFVVGVSLDFETNMLLCLETREWILCGV